MAIGLVRDVIKINREANFEIYRWASNSRRVLDSVHKFRPISNTHVDRLCDLKIGERVLGMVWGAGTDELKFNADRAKISAKILSGEVKPTKREVLRVVMSLFDPLVLLAPFTIKSKILMQEIWCSGVGWDELIRDEEQIGWSVWLRVLRNVIEWRVPRCIAQSG